MSLKSKVMDVKVHRKHCEQIVNPDDFIAKSSKSRKESNVTLENGIIMSHAVPLFDEYAMIKNISGSSGALVYIGIDKSTNRKCVVKFLPFSMDHNLDKALEKAKKQTKAEVQKMAKDILSEISIACIMSYDERRYFPGLIRFGDTTKLEIDKMSQMMSEYDRKRFHKQIGLFMVMPYLETYTDMLNIRTSYAELSEATKFEILVEILRAYQIASNVVGAYFHHTDSHSKNVLIDIDPSNGTLRGLKLIDFDSAAFNTNRANDINDAYMQSVEQDIIRYTRDSDDKIQRRYTTGFPHDASGVPIRKIRELIMNWHRKGALATVGYHALVAWKLIAYGLANSMSKTSKLREWLFSSRMLEDYADYDSNFQNMISLLHDKSYFPNPRDYKRLVKKYRNCSVYPLPEPSILSFF